VFEECPKILPVGTTYSYQAFFPRNCRQMERSQGNVRKVEVHNQGLHYRPDAQALDKLIGCEDDFAHLV